MPQRHRVDAKVLYSQGMLVVLKKNLPDPPLGLCSVQMILPHWQLIFSSLLFNPLTLMSDQDRISPYNINKISTR